MSFANYGGLKAEVASWLNRDDLTANIPSFIRLAEARILREVRWAPEQWSISESAPGGFVVDAYPKAMPSSVYIFEDIWSVGTPYLGPIEIVDAPEWRRLVHSSGDSAGTPRKAYVTVDNETGNLLLAVWPQPSTTIAIDFTFRRRVTPLATDNETNPVLRDHPDLYLYAALAESAPFLQHDERLPVWEASYERIRKAVAGDRDNRTMGSRPMRVALKRF